MVLSAAISKFDGQCLQTLKADMICAVPHSRAMATQSLIMEI